MFIAGQRKSAFHQVRDIALMGRMRFNPRTLFSQGEQGAWYDPSDITSMYQDSAGTTAAVVGQPVGLLLDKRLGLVRGATIAQSFIGLTAGAGTAVNNGDGTITLTNGGSVRLEYPLASLVNGRFYEANFAVSARTGTITVDWCDGVGSQVTTAAHNHIGSRATYDATYRFLDVISAAGASITFAIPTLRELPGNHATQATSASRPTLQQDASGYYYLSFDGSDDGMVTGAIDCSATDKMTVWAGLNKQSDAATGLVLELSATTDTNNGSFFLAAPRTGAVADYGWRSKGTVVADVQSAASYAAPVSSVITCIGDIAGDASRIKVNGGAAVSVVTDQGTGNYGNYPLYIGRRGGDSLPFNGRIYSLIVRGAASDSAQISAGERYVGSKMGIVL